MLRRDKAHRLRALIVQAAASLPDEEALDGVELFEAWRPGADYAAGDRVRYGGKLYRCEQAHTSQGGWEPDKTPALWTEVTLPGDGDTPDRPIHYSGNMALENGKYYTQGDVVYVCTRDTGVPVYNDLAALVGLYVEVYTP